MLNFIVSTETPLSDLTHDSRLIDSFDSLILYTHINRTAVSREKYSMILFFLFTPSPALNIILGHPRSSHSESLSLVLKLFSVLFVTYIGDSWNSLVSYRLQSWNFTLGHYGCRFSGKIFAPTKGPRSSQTGQISLQTSCFTINVEKTTRLDWVRLGSVIELNRTHKKIL